MNMPSSAILITGCNAPYFTLVCELLESINVALPARGFDLGVLDLGLLPEQRQHLTAAGVEVVAPAWDIPGIQLDPHNNWYKAMTARPYLPRHFPRRDLLMWLDADIWVQRGEAIELFLRNAAQFGFAIVPEMHRAYDLQGAGAVALHTHVYRQCFGTEWAAELIQLPVLNSGAFAARRDSPVWVKWAALCRAAMARHLAKHTEQAALNAALYSRAGDALELLPARCDYTFQQGNMQRVGGERFCALPAVCNWVCALTPPMWDASRRQFVVPQPPHESLALVHLCNERLHQTVPIQTLGGGPPPAGYRWRFVKDRLRLPRG